MSQSITGKSTHLQAGGSTEKIWAHWFLAKPKAIAAGGAGGAVSPQGIQSDNLVKKPPNNFFFVGIKHTEMVIVRVNIG